MNKDHIVSYLAQDFPATQVASILGCSESYISEVKTESWFPDALVEAKKKIKKTQEESHMDDEYIKLESSLLTNIREQMPFADFRDLVRLTETLIRRKQSHVAVGSIVFNNNTNNSVLLSIPTVVAPEITVNSRREILAVGEQTMAPMTTHSVRDLFSKIKEAREVVPQLAALLAEGKTITQMPDDF